MQTSEKHIKSGSLVDPKRPHSTSEPLRVIVSGGGTGGHVFPAIAIAQALKQMDSRTEILFVGAKGRLEMEKVPQAGFRIEGLWISGFQRSLSLRNLLFPIKLLSSLWKARRIIKTFAPDIVVGVGGYASGPLLEMAVRMHIPALIQEQNSFPGVTNRLLAGRVDRICVAYAGMEVYFPEKKIIIAGNPVRKDLEDRGDKREKGLKHFQLDPQNKTILVLGGSGGARTLNEALRDNYKVLSEESGVQIIWQCGKSYYEGFKNTETAQAENVHLYPFLDAMDLAYAVADLVISRAGALTIAELAVTGKPAVLVPSSFVAGDHQSKNASAMEKAGAAIVIRDEQAADAVPAAIEIIKDERRLSELASNMKKEGRPQADERIAAEIMNLALTKRKKP